MTIRRCVAYRNDLHGAFTFDLKVKYLFLNSIFLPGPYHFCLVVVVQMAALRGDISLSLFLFVHSGVEYVLTM